MAMDEMSRYIELKPKYDLCEPSSKELIKTQNLQGMLRKTEMLRNFRRHLTGGYDFGNLHTFASSLRIGFIR